MIAAAAWLGVTITALPATEEHTNRRFAASPGGQVIVDVDFGSLTLATNATCEVVVDVWRTIKRAKKTDEELFLRQNPVMLTQDGSTVTIRSHGETKPHWSWPWGKSSENQAKYLITVPSQFNTQLKTGGGAIVVQDLAGEAKVRAGGGGLEFARLHGPLDADTGGGGIVTRHCDGDIKLNTGGGGVELTGGAGSLKATTGGGHLSVKSFQGPVHLRSGGGGLILENVTGEVDGSTGGGSISLVLPAGIVDSVRLSTAGGGIEAVVPTTAAFNFEAQTAGGSIRTDLPLVGPGKRKPGWLQGQVNGGGKTVALQSGGGSIHLKTE